MHGTATAPPEERSPQGNADQPSLLLLLFPYLLDNQHHARHSTIARLPCPLSHTPRPAARRTPQYSARYHLCATTAPACSASLHIAARWNTSRLRSRPRPVAATSLPSPNQSYLGQELGIAASSAPRAQEAIGLKLAPQPSASHSAGRDSIQHGTIGPASNEEVRSTRAAVIWRNSDTMRIGSSSSSVMVLAERPVCYPSLLSDTFQRFVATDLIAQGRFADAINSVMFLRSSRTTSQTAESTANRSNLRCGTLPDRKTMSV